MIISKSLETIDSAIASVERRSLTEAIKTMKLGLG